MSSSTVHCNAAPSIPVATPMIPDASALSVVAGARRREKGGEDKDKMPVNPCPGTYEEVDRDGKELFALAANFSDGAKFEVTQKIVDKLDQATSFDYSSHLGSSVHQGKHHNEFRAMSAFGQDAFMQGRVDMEGNVNGVIVVSPASHIKATCNWGAMVDPSKDSIGMELVYKGSDWAAELKAARQQDMLQLATNYTQHVTRNLIGGVEVIAVSGGGELRSLMNGKLVYRNVNEAAKATLPPGMPLPKEEYALGVQANGSAINMSYFKNVNENLAMGSDVQFSAGVPGRSGLSSVAQLGYKYSGRIFQCTGIVNSDGVVMSSLDYIILGIVKFSVNNMVDHDADKSSFGMGLHLTLP